MMTREELEEYLNKADYIMSDIIGVEKVFREGCVTYDDTMILHSPSMEIYDKDLEFMSVDKDGEISYDGTKGPGETYRFRFVEIKPVVLGTARECAKCTSTNLMFSHYKKNGLITTVASRKNGNTELIHSIEYQFYWKWRAKRSIMKIRCLNCGLIEFKREGE